MTATVVEPVHRSIHIDSSPTHAFETFTARLGEWWPLATHSIGLEKAIDATLEPWEGGRLYERMQDGREAHWATVSTWQPPHRLVLEWKVNPSAVAPTEIDVRFTAEGDGTRVDLEHRGWERLGAGALDARASYAADWPMVLGRFGEAARP